MSKINKLGQYKGVEIKVTKQTVTQEEIEAQLNAIVAQNQFLKKKMVR